MSGPYQITFFNRTYALVQAQIAVGNNQNCDLNNPYTVSLHLNVGYPISTSEPVVCYRRRADPNNSSSPWLPWNSFSPDDMNTPADITVA
jgi:hypothetical protein